MKAHSRIPSLSDLVDYRPGVELENYVRLYNSADENNKLAILSHFLHNGAISESKAKSTIEAAFLDFIQNGTAGQSAGYVTTGTVSKADDSGGSCFCSDLFRVPFPNPKSSEFTFIDLFAGIGGIRLPFSEMGYKCVFSSEWDKNAQTTYLANFGEMPFGDICQESTKQFIPQKFDLLLAGFPCQAFSIIGKMKGFEDIRGTMFFEVASILKKHRPRAFLLENVKQLTTHDKGKTFSTICQTLTELGYHYKWTVLNALDFGLPQKRERVIIVGFRDEKLIEDFDFTFEKTPYSLSSILEDDSAVDQSLFASEPILNKRLEKTRDRNIFYPSVWHENKSGNISILDHACALRTGASYNYLLINGRRRPSSRELLRFQGFPEQYRITVSHSEIRRQTGNSVPVPMIRAVAHKIDRILRMRP